MLQCGRFTLSLEQPLVMGIINVTPDSFFDGGHHGSVRDAVLYGLRLVEEGADILDIGGESTRPGAAAVGVEEELSRVLPILEGLRDCGVPVSVDTSKPRVMQAALAAGADMINDVCALREEGALQAVAESRAALCLMHMQGEPRTMQQHPIYEDVTAEVVAFLRYRLADVVEGGIARQRLVVDPGFGFGKMLEHNLALLRELDQFLQLGVPVMVGLSRKSMLGAVTGLTVGDRMIPSVAAALIAAMKGARIIRVHDVKETRQALQVLNAVGGE